LWTILQNLFRHALGELLRLRQSDLDWNAGILTVQEQRRGTFAGSL